jgi:hypothetical protein
VQVTGRDRRPGVVDLGQGVEQRHHRAQRGRAALAALARELVVHVGAGTVGAERDRAVAEDDVVARLARREPDLTRRARETALDELPRQLRGQAGAVDARARLLEQVDGRRRVVADADLLEHPHGLFVDVLPVLAAQVV